MKPRRELSEKDAPLIEVINVGKIYEPSPPAMKILLRSSITEPVVALEDVSLSVPAGGICAVVGPNGAGKSTLFRILTGLTIPSSGQAFVGGYDVTRQSYEVRKLIGFAPPGDQSLLLRNTCKENLEFHGRLQGIPGKALTRRVREVLEFVGIGHAANRVTVALSSGMKARLQLARALLHRPSVLILDEPTAAVDPIAAVEILDMIQAVVAHEQSALLISSHRVEEIEALRDKVVLLDQGRMLYQGPLDALRSIWEEPRVEMVFSDVDEAMKAAALIEQSEVAKVVDQEGAVLLLATRSEIGALLGTLQGMVHGIKSVREVVMPLRELLAEVIGQKRPIERSQ